MFIVCGVQKIGIIFCSYLPLCLFDVPYMEGRGETKFLEVPWEPLWVGPGPRCESEVTPPPGFEAKGFQLSTASRYQSISFVSWYSSTVIRLRDLQYVNEPSEGFFGSSTSANFRDHSV